MHLKGIEEAVKEETVKMNGECPGWATRQMLVKGTKRGNIERAVGCMEGNEIICLWVASDVSVGSPEKSPGGSQI